VLVLPEASDLHVIPPCDSGYDRLWLMIIDASIQWPYLPLRSESRAMNPRRTRGLTGFQSISILAKKGTPSAPAEQTDRPFGPLLLTYTQQARKEHGHIFDLIADE
jgi:hypothetical protein